MNHILCFLPSYVSLYCNAKCFFIVGNLIVIILIRELRAARSSHPSPASDMYDEYIARSGGLCKLNSDVLAEKKEEDGVIQSMNIEEKKHGNIRNASHHEEKKKEMRVCKTMHHEEKIKEMRACKSEVWGESEIVKGKKANGEKEDRLYLPREELNKRVEAFIARVNKQRLFEAKLVDHGRG